MRLSDIKGERALDVIADLIDPIANIAQDKEALALFRGVSSENMGDRARAAVPALLKGHRDDLIDIMAAIKGVDREEYVEQMTLANVVGDVYELLTDEEFLSFLPSLEQTGE